VAEPTAIPAVVSTVIPTVAATVELPGAAAPVVLSTREAVTAGPYEIQGTGTPGSLVEVLVNGASIGTATVGADGRWSLPTTLEAGSAEIVAQAVNESGAVLAAGEPVQLTVGAALGGAAGATTGPIGLPAIEPPLIVSSFETVFAGPRTIEGSGTPGSTVELLVNGEPVGTAVVGDDGRWSIDTVLEAGLNELQPRAIDEAGALLAEQDPVTFDVQPAEAATGAAPTIDLPTGDLAGGPGTLTGRGEPGSTVRVTIGGVDAGEATVGADGSWTLDVLLPAGQQEIVAETLDNDGNVIAASEPAAVNVVGGLGVTLSEPVEGAELPAGPTTVSGTGAAGTVLEILNGDQVLGETTVGADGTWTTEVTLEDGSSSISVREKGTDQVLNRPVRVQIGDAAAAAPACTEVAVGCDAWVTRAGGLTLRMRSAPTTQGDNIIARLPIGTQMRVEEGPQSADGFTWWRVITVGGNEGWVAGENLVLQPD
jgi:hypothetical protein